MAIEKGSVLPSRAVGAAHKHLAIEGQTASQGGEDNVLRKVLVFVGHAAISPRDFDEGPAYRTHMRHGPEPYHSETPHSTLGSPGKEAGGQVVFKFDRLSRKAMNVLELAVDARHQRWRLLSVYEPLDTPTSTSSLIASGPTDWLQSYCDADLPFVCEPYEVEPGCFDGFRLGDESCVSSCCVPRASR